MIPWIGPTLIAIGIARFANWACWADYNASPPFVQACALVGIGWGLIRHARMAERQGHELWEARAGSLTQPGLQILKPSWYGLMASSTFACLALVNWVVTASAQRIPVGLTIRMVRPGVAGPNYAGIQPLRIQIGPGSEKLYVDSKSIHWENLDAVLRTELSRRPPNWPVYVDGNPDLEWKDVAPAIDALRGLGAEVVLVTRSLK